MQIILIHACMILDWDLGCRFLGPNCDLLGSDMAKTLRRIVIQSILLNVSPLGLNYNPINKRNVYEYS